MLMVNFPGRNGRRRRVLNEEVLSASSAHVALRAVADGDESSRDMRPATATRPASRTIRKSPTSCRAATARLRCWC